jgi:hypothetical protein
MKEFVIQQKLVYAIENDLKSLIDSIYHIQVVNL